MPRVLAGKKMSVLGRLDALRSFTYVPDVVATMVTIAAGERARGSHGTCRAPRLSARGETVQMRPVPRLALTPGGLFEPALKSVREILSQRDLP